MLIRKLQLIRKKPHGILVIMLIIFFCTLKKGKKNAFLFHKVLVLKKRRHVPSPKEVIIFLF